MSVFEVINKTSHEIQIAVHPDPRNQPEQSESINPIYASGCTKLSTIEETTRKLSKMIDSDHQLEVIDSNDSYNIPMLLLEASLHVDGSHLGSLWMRPNDCVRDELLDSLALEHSNDLDSPSHSTIGFSSFPLQLAKVVHASLTEENKGPVA